MNKILCLVLLAGIVSGCAAGIKYTNPTCEREEFVVYNEGIFSEARVDRFLDGQLYEIRYFKGAFKEFLPETVVFNSEGKATVMTVIMMRTKNGNEIEGVRLPANTKGCNDHIETMLEELKDSGYKPWVITNMY